MAIIYFGLGSNLGNRLQNLRDALTKLETLGKIILRSDVFETPAWGGVPQPDYLNACVKLETFSDITPPEILSTIKNFESEIGRVPSVRWGARKIDIDILMIDDLIYNSPDLIIPHASMTQRLFVLVPLKNILPENWKHPMNKKSIHEMINDLKSDDEILRITNL